MPKHPPARQGEFQMPPKGSGFIIGPSGKPVFVGEWARQREQPGQGEQARPEGLPDWAYPYRGKWARDETKHPALQVLPALEREERALEQARPQGQQQPTQQQRATQTPAQKQAELDRINEQLRKDWRAAWGNEPVFPGQGRQAAPQQPRQAQAFRESLPQRPAAPRFGNVRGGNIFEQAQGFMGQMGRYIDQGGARQAARGAQARRAASIKGWQDWNIKSRQRDTEDWKAKHPDWKQVEPPDAELGGAPPPIMFVNPQDPNQIVTLTPQGAVAHTQEEIQEEHAAAQQWVSEGGDLAAMNEDLVKRGFPPLVGG